jgi:hypothetical protein
MLVICGVLSRKHSLTVQNECSIVFPPASISFTEETISANNNHFFRRVQDSRSRQRHDQREHLDVLWAKNVPARYYTELIYSDLEECLSECEQDSQCALFQLFKTNGTCYLYTADSFSIVMSVSSVINTGHVWQKQIDG